jgi:hypothetical protein
MNVLGQTPIVSARLRPSPGWPPNGMEARTSGEFFPRACMVAKNSAAAGAVTAPLRASPAEAAFYRRGGLKSSAAPSCQRL